MALESSEKDTEAFARSVEDVAAELASQMVGLQSGSEDFAEAPLVVKISDAPEVYEVQVPFINVITSETNVFVVKDHGEALIIDTGAPSDEGERVLRAALAELDVDPQKATYFLTHLHLDHAGLVDRMVPRSATIYLSKVDFDYMNLSASRDFWPVVETQLGAEDFSDDAAQKFSRYGMGIRAFDAQGRTLRFVSEGDEISVGETRLRVVDTSGHTPGHTSLFHEESGLFFVGDHVLFAISPGLGLRPGVSDTAGVYFKNLRKMLDMPISRILVSHGALKDGWRDRVEGLLAHHRRRMDRAIDYIAAHPGATGREVVLNMKWNVPLPWEEISDAQKWCIVESGITALDHLVAEGSVLRTQDETGRHRYRKA